MKSPLAGYYGGKHRMRHTICEMIPKHTTYVEPFFGGGSVFFTKPKSKVNVINDIDNKIYRFWQVCKYEENKLYERFDKFLYHETEYIRVKKVIRNEIKPKDEIDFAYCMFVCMAMSFSGAYLHPGSLAISKRSKYISIKNKIKLLKDIYKVLENVEIHNKDALDLIKRVDRKESFFYLDPPYPETDQDAYSGYTMDNFNKLCELLKTIKGKFILSCYLKEGMNLNPDWNKKFIKNILKVNHYNNTDTKRTECLIYNYELDQMSLGI